MEDYGTLVPGKWYADYPLWTHYDRDLDHRLGLGAIGGIPQTNLPGIGPLLLIFTDSDLAARVAQDVGRSDMIQIALPDPATVLKVAERFQQCGVKQVGIDLAFKPSGVMLVPIAEFMEDVKRGIKP